MHVFFYTKLKWGKNWPRSRENLVPICKSIFCQKIKKQAAGKSQAVKAMTLQTRTTATYKNRRGAIGSKRSCYKTHSKSNFSTVFNIKKISNHRFFIQFNIYCLGGQIARWEKYHAVYQRLYPACPFKKKKEHIHYFV